MKEIRKPIISKLTKGPILQQLHSIFHPGEAYNLSGRLVPYLLLIEQDPGVRSKWMEEYELKRQLCLRLLLEGPAGRQETGAEQ